MGHFYENFDQGEKVVNIFILYILLAPPSNTTLNYIFTTPKHVIFVMQLLSLQLF